MAFSILEFLLFKFFYPCPDFLSDSYDFISAASVRAGVGFLPIGYSNFLGAFHDLNLSDTALIAFQYFFYVFTASYFFSTIQSLFNPRKSASLILFSFLFVNPIFLYISNCITSDSLVASISLLWISQLLQIIHRPHFRQILITTVILFLLFALTNVFYYVIITIAVILLSGFTLLAKLTGTALNCLCIGTFVILSLSLTKKETGTAQLSFSSGWQIANNALYMRDYITADTVTLPTPETRQLDNLAKSFFRHAGKNVTSYLIDNESNVFIQYSNSPLRKFYQLHYDPKNNYARLMDAGNASPIFATYGNYLIRNYPQDYFKYFLLKNLKNYFFPPLEQLQTFHGTGKDIPALAQEWFDYQTPIISSKYETAKIGIFSVFSYFFLLITIWYTGSLFLWIYKKRTLYLPKPLGPSVLLLNSYLIINFLHSIFSSTIGFRQEIIALVVCTTFTIVTLEFLDKNEKSVDKTKIIPNKNAPEISLTH